MSLGSHRLRKSIEVIGHRGSKGLLPELSLAGFSRALEIGVHAIEFDIQVSFDGAVVAYHDHMLNPDITRYRNGNWLEDKNIRVSSLTLDELRQFDIGKIRPGSNYERDFPNQQPVNGSRIPTLAEIVELVHKSERKVYFCIEIKHSPRCYKSKFNFDQFVQVVCTEIEQLAITEQSIIQSFDWSVIHAIRKRIPKLQVWHLTAELKTYNTVKKKLNGLWTDGFLATDSNNSIPHMVHIAGGKVWSCNYQSLTPSRIAEAQSLGLKVYAWTVNTNEDFGKLCDAGIDGIITDYPDRLIRYLQTRN